MCVNIDSLAVWPGLYTHNLGIDENVRANLRQYGLESRYVDMLVADAAKCAWREQELFNAILTDREIALPAVMVALNNAQLLFSSLWRPRRWQEDRVKVQYTQSSPTRMVIYNTYYMSQSGIWRDISRAGGHISLTCGS